MTIALVLVALLVIVVGYFVSTQRTLVQLDENCKNALGQIQVQLNSRWDALLALAKTASQYAKHESETLINVINARRQGTVATTAQDINAQQGELSQVMGRLIAI
jgi:LemA protein